jgi:hypothetical protein
MKRELLISLFLKMSKENLAAAAADLILADPSEPTAETTEVEYPNNGKRISNVDIDTVLKAAGPMGSLLESELYKVAKILGRKPDSIAAILRTHYKPPSSVEAEREPDEAIDGPS